MANKKGTKPVPAASKAADITILAPNELSHQVIPDSIIVIPGDLVAKANAIKVTCETMPVSDEATYTDAGEALKNVHAIIKEVDKRVDEGKAPFYQLYQGFLKSGKTLTTLLEAGKKSLSQRMGAYQAKIQREAEEERRRAAAREEEERKAREVQMKEQERQRVAEALERGELPPDEPIVPPPQPEEVKPMVFTQPAPRVAGTQVRRKPRYEVVDESQLPEKYWKRVVDEDLIKFEVDNGKLVPEGDGPTTIHGIRVWIETSVNSSGR